MNKLKTLFFLDFKLLTKNKTFYFKLLLFPTVLILILGTVFSNANSKVPSFSVAFYSEDTGINLGQVLEDKALKAKEIKNMITVKEVSNYQEGKNLVDKGTVSTFVYVPKDFTNDFFQNTKTNVTILDKGDNSIDKSIVKNIIDGFIQSTKTVFIEEKEVLAMSPPSKEATSKLLSYIENEQIYSTAIPKIATKRNVVPIDVMQYYSIAMVVMFSIITALTLVHSIVDERLNHTLFRIKSTPTLNLQYALGKLLGIVFAVAMQMIIVILITGLAFRMAWGNIFDILLITIIYAFSIGAVILLWGLIAKDQISVSSISSPILYGFSFLGGSFVSKDGLPDSLKLVQQIIPNGKAINCYLKICQGGGLGDIYMDLIQLMLIGAIFLALALVAYNGRMWMNNANSANGKKTAKATV